MALKIDFLQSIYAKITEAFNNSTVLKEGGNVSTKDKIDNIFLSDGYPYDVNIPGDSNISTLGSAVTIKAGTLTTLSTFRFPPQKSYLAKSINIICDSPKTMIIVRFQQIDLNTTGGSSTEINTYTQRWVYFESADTKSLDLGDMVILENTTIVLLCWVKGASTLDVPKPFAHATMSGIMATNDLNINAKKIICMIGDSYLHTKIANESTSTLIYGDQYFPVIIRDRLLRAKKKC